jgi:hypothetical protein
MDMLRAARPWPMVVLLAMTAAFSASRADAAGTAYGVDTAEVGDIGNCKVESWLSWASNQDFLAIANPSCVVNLGRAVEVSAQIQRFRQDGEWGASVAPKFKTNLIPSAIGRFGVAVAAGATYDALNNEVTGYFASIPATIRLSNVVRINVNAGWSWDRIADRHYLTYGAGLDWRTPDNVWTLTTEVFGQLGEVPEDKSRTLVQPRFQVGLRWRPIDRFSMDLILGRNITGENANWITLATSIRFPAEGKKAGE